MIGERLWGFGRECASNVSSRVEFLRPTDLPSVGGHDLGDREIVGEMGASMRVGGVGAVANLCISEVAAR
jgi:hypothetical protein